MSTKGLVIKPREKITSIYDGEEEEEPDEWMDFDQYMREFGDYYAEEFEAEKQRKKQISIPSAV